MKNRLNSFPPLPKPVNKPEVFPDGSVGQGPVDPTEIYRESHQTLFARLEDGSLALLEGHNNNGRPMIDAMVMKEGGPVEVILPSVLGVSEVKKAQVDDIAEGMPDLYKEAAGAGDDSPWMRAGVVLCVPSRTDEGPAFELHVRDIESVTPRAIRFPRGTDLDLTAGL
jgi:hypothetical protein